MTSNRSIYLSRPRKRTMRIAHKTIIAALVAASTSALAAPLPSSVATVKAAALNRVESVRWGGRGGGWRSGWGWRRGWGWGGWGLAGVATGLAVAGGAYGYYPYGYAYGYG